MRETSANQLAELEQRMGSDLGRAVLTLADTADAVRDPTDPHPEAIAQAALRLRNASRSIDTDLVTITARQAPVASDLRLVLALVQLAHHESLIANLVLARGLERKDDAIDKLNRDVFKTTVNLETAPDCRELALRHVLIARSLGRIGDNAVDIAEQAAFLGTARTARVLRRITRQPKKP